MFFAERRLTKDRDVRSALLSSAFYSQKKRSPYPVQVPAALQAALPVPADEISPLMAGARRTSAAQGGGAGESADEYFERAVAHGLKRRQPEAEPQLVKGALRRKRATRARSNGAAAKEPHDAYTDIVFNDQQQITTITVHSWVSGVPERAASQIALMARPPNWSHAVPSFYHRSDPVEWSERVGGYVSLENEPKGGAYDLLEYVTWDWSPQVNGGIANILAMEEHKPNPKSVEALVDAILEQAKQEKDGSRSSIPIPRGRNAYASPHAVTYTYRLVRCLQAKFVSTWEPGGLDVDEGRFTVAWLPSTKTLYASGEKTLRYSYQADVVPGFASTLNMLAPAVTSMLMKQLVYHGFVDYLEASQTPGRTP